MIRFKCIYCGQRILAPDNGAGKKGKCPKCKHSVVVPKTTAGRPAISPDISEETQRQREAAALSSPAFTRTEEPVERRGDYQVELFREKAGWLIPAYDELSLFLMSATIILLGVANSTMREQVLKTMLIAHDVRLFLLGLIFLAGMVFSLYHVFTTREKTDFEKWAMLIFAVGVNIVTAAAAGYYLFKLNKTTDWRIFFPLWNFANAVLLFLMMRFRIIDQRCIIDRDAAPFQVIFGLIMVVIIFLFCNYVFKLYWAITFSICVAYTTSIDKALQSVLPGLANRENCNSIKESQRDI